MDLLNRGISNVSFEMRGSIKKVTLKPGQRIPVNETRNDVRYYQQLKPLGLFLVPGSKRVEKEVTDTEETTSKDVVDSSTEEEVDLISSLESEDTVGEGTVDGSYVHAPFVPVTEGQTDEDQEILENDKDLSGGSVYTFDFLTKNKCITILENRGIKFDPKTSARDLKNIVLETNPVV